MLYNYLLNHESYSKTYFKIRKSKCYIRYLINFCLQYENAKGIFHVLIFMFFRTKENLLIDVYYGKEKNII